MTTLEWWCELTTCPTCKGRGYVIGQVLSGCPCSGTGRVLRHPTRPDNWLYRRLDAASREVASWPPEKQARINPGYRV